MAFGKTFTFEKFLNYKVRIYKDTYSLYIENNFEAMGAEIIAIHFVQEKCDNTT